MPDRNRAELADGRVPEAALITLLNVTDRDRRSKVAYARDRHNPLPLGRSAAASGGETDETVIELTGEYFVATGKKPRALLLPRDPRPSALGTLLNHLGGAAACSLNKQRLGATLRRFLLASELLLADLTDDASCFAWHPIRQA